jgi:hypothetical protein
MWRVSRRNCHGRKLHSLLPKTAPKSIFRKTRFLFVFTKPPPHLFSGQNRQCGAFQGKIGMDEFARFCLKRPQNLFFFFFPKNTFPVCFYETPSHLFSGPYGLMQHVSRQNYHGRKLRSLLPKPAPKWFFRKTCFRSFFTKPPLTYFQGQKDYIARFEAKSSRTKTSLAFA